MMGAVLGGPALDDQHVADLHARALPARALEYGGRAHLERPVRDPPGIGILHVDVEVGVRILPLHAGHRPGHLERLGVVVLGRERMVRRNGHARRERQQRDIDGKGSRYSSESPAGWNLASGPGPQGPGLCPAIERLMPDTVLRPEAWALRPKK